MHPNPIFASLQFHDLIGACGAGMLLITYLLLQINRISAKSMVYSQLNGWGSGLILISLCYDFNLAAFIIEACWFAISWIGALVTLNHLRQKRKRERLTEN